MFIINKIKNLKRRREILIVNVLIKQSVYLKILLVFIIVISEGRLSSTNYYGRLSLSENKTRLSF